tara:strand:+ start:1941 stop:2171 length:231 start_codon:yes stop_codon:yes gene_type:complete
MTVLDLHGIPYNNVEKIVIEFIFFNEAPFKIITGKSHSMVSMVHEILEKYNFTYYPENYTNYGAYIIQDKENSVYL